MSEEIRDIDDLTTENPGTEPPENPGASPEEGEEPETPVEPTEPDDPDGGDEGEGDGDSGEEPSEGDDKEPSGEEDEPYTLAEYLQGISDLLTDKALRVVLAKRRLKGDTPVDELSEKELDLAEAEVYYQLCNLPVGGSTTKDVDGSWSHTEGGWTVSGANIAEWWKKYVSLRQKWGESVLKKSTIRVHARGMRVWRRRR